MEIGVPKEIKPQEFRVGLTPAGVRELTTAGHAVLVESGAGVGIGLDDINYQQAGATIVSTAEDVYKSAAMIVKVKEPQLDECQLLQEKQILFAYLHLAADPQQALLLQQRDVTAIAYETVTNQNGGLPLLAPMSEIAGRFAAQAAARCLEKSCGGSGRLLGGVPGVPASEVLVIGGGVVGLNAARVAAGLGARVTIMDKSLPRLTYIDDVFGPVLSTCYATEDAINDMLKRVDVVVGAVLVPGGTAPKLISRSQLDLMKTGSAIVDVAIDQGGCIETSRATTHAEPVFIEQGIVHYCVANIPGAVAHTSTYALTNATLPFVRQLADHGLAVLKDNPHFRHGLNVFSGAVTHPAVAESLLQRYTDPQELLSVFATR